jgi:hypothetical protein
MANGYKRMEIDIDIVEETNVSQELKNEMLHPLYEKLGFKMLSKPLIYANIHTIIWLQPAI